MTVFCKQPHSSRFCLSFLTFKCKVALDLRLNLDRCWISTGASFPISTFSVFPVLFERALSALASLIYSKQPLECTGWRKITKYKKSFYASAPAEYFHFYQCGCNASFSCKACQKLWFFFSQSVDAPDILKKCIFYKQEDRIRRRADRHGGRDTEPMRKEDPALFSPVWRWVRMENPAWVTGGWAWEAAERRRRRQVIDGVKMSADK